MELIDTHCHLTFDDLAQDIDGVIERSRKAGVTGWITVGTDMRENQKAVELTARFENLYAAVGIHPHDARTVIGETISELKTLAWDPKVVAIGETGLDYHYNHSLRHEQRRAFARHLEIAAELNLPVIIHCRKAFDETVEILHQYGRDVKKIVWHCFSASAEQAQILIPKGYYFSFTGVVTFKNAEKTRKAAAVIPLDRLMLETDCPYMSPEPMRKQQVNEPALMVHTAKFLADLKGMSLEDFAAAATAAAKAFFNLPDNQ
jgi:TatD DNase family protein